MPLIELTTSIAAPVGRVFDLSRSIDLHMESMAHNEEKAIAGVTHGLIGAGQKVTWWARHFGMAHTLTVLITEFDPPSHFADAMLYGPFKSMIHHHYFDTAPDGTTTMRDAFDYASPFGVLGRFVDGLFLERYMTSLLLDRNRVIKSTAEGDDWERFLRED